MRRSLSLCSPGLHVWRCLICWRCLSISAVCTMPSCHISSFPPSFFLHPLSILPLYLPNPFFFWPNISTICASPGLLYFLLSFCLGPYLLQDHVILLEPWHLFPSTSCIYSTCLVSEIEWWSWAHLVVSVLAPEVHYLMHSCTVYWTLLYCVWPKTSKHQWGRCDYWGPSNWRPWPQSFSKSTLHHQLFEMMRSNQKVWAPKAFRAGQAQCWRVTSE